MNCSINQIQPSSVGSYLEGDWMCLVSDTLTLTLRDLKNLCDSVSPNIETTGFTPLFARVLPPWPQIGPVLVPSPDLTIKIFHQDWRREVIIFSGPGLLKLQICRGHIICHQDKPLKRSENKTTHRKIIGEAQVSGSCCICLALRPFLSSFIVSRILRLFPRFPPSVVQTL